MSSTGQNARQASKMLPSNATSAGATRPRHAARTACCLPDGPNGVRINVNPGSVRPRWQAGPAATRSPLSAPDSLDDGNILLPSLPMHPSPARRCATPLATDSQRPRQAGVVRTCVCGHGAACESDTPPLVGRRTPPDLCLLAATRLGCLPDVSACSLLLGILRSTVVLALADRSVSAPKRDPSTFSGESHRGSHLLNFPPRARDEPCFAMVTMRW